MTRAQNRGAQVRRKLGLHSQADAETAANRPGLEVWAWPFRALSSLLMALTPPPLPAVRPPTAAGPGERHLTRPPLTDLSLPTISVGNSPYEAQAA